MLWMKDLKCEPYVWLLQLQNTFTDVYQISHPLQLDMQFMSHVTELRSREDGYIYMQTYVLMFMINHIKIKLKSESTDPETSKEQCSVCVQHFNQKSSVGKWQE